MDTPDLAPQSVQVVRATSPAITIAGLYPERNFNAFVTSDATTVNPAESPTQSSRDQNQFAAQTGRRV